MLLWSERPQRIVSQAAHCATGWVGETAFVSISQSWVSRPGG